MSRPRSRDSDLVVRLHHVVVAVNVHRPDVELALEWLGDQILRLPLALEVGDRISQVLSITAAPVSVIENLLSAGMLGKLFACLRTLFRSVRQLHKKLGHDFTSLPRQLSESHADRNENVITAADHGRIVRLMIYRANTHPEALLLHP